jgi:hypothetical protein
MAKNAGEVEIRRLKNISQRLSLRPPQSESLALLAEIAGLLPLTKNSDLASASPGRLDLIFA